MFRTNRSRTILTILGISVGIGAILFLVSLGYGLQRLILSQITTSESLLSLDVGTGDLVSLKLDNKAVGSIKDIPGVEKISPLVSLSVQMSVADVSSEIIANFASRDYFNLEGTILKKGNFYSETSEDKNKVIISSSALRLFNLNEANCFDKKISFTLFVPNKDKEDKESENLVRDSVNLTGAFQISGIIEEENSNYVYLPFSISQGLGIEDYSKLKVKVVDDDNLDIVREAIIEKGFMVSAL
ncbi:ABC transporter permease, partial [Candidatus Parcubacteria bacterium]|nr:ABC transporter permease [Candidatus Parcubacteria bacterium]